MNKKKTLLLVPTAIASIAVMASFTYSFSQIKNAVAVKDRLVTPGDYTLTLDSNNKIANDNSVLTELGNKVLFDMEGNVNKNPSSGWFEFGDTEISGSVFNTSPISGMTSISFSMNYSEVYLHYGYKEDDTIHYSNYRSLVGADQGDDQYLFEFSFSEVFPSYFKLECFSKNKTISTLTIQYSCSESEKVPTELSSFSSFTYISEEDAYRVDGLVGSRKKIQTLIVPGTYNGKPVVEIAQNAFFTNLDIEYVIIEEGVKRIGKQAFYLDASLKYIVLPSTIESVGDKAFDGCAGLTSQTIPAATTNVSLSAYAGNAFLEEIIVEEGNTVYYSDNGMLYEKATDTLLVCPAGIKGTVTVPNTCKKIGSVAFKNSRATTISIGSGVTEIEETFKTCKSLTTFVVDSNNNYFAAYSSTNSSGTVNMLCDGLLGTVYAYARGSTATTLTMPSSVRVIEDKVFEGVSSLIAINLSSTTHIGEEAFINMPNLENIGLPSAIDIGPRAFQNNPKLTTVTLCSNLQVLPEETFMNCTSLASISFPHSLSTISAKAFKGCSALSSINLPDQLLRTIGSEAFMNCTSLDVDDVPDCINSFGTDVFRNTATDSLVLSAAIDYIPDGMFRDCDELTSFTIPDYIKTIGYDAFRDCNNLTSVTIPDNSVTTIRSRAFYEASFSSIYIPKAVTTIEGSAFGGRNFTIYTDVTTPSGYGDVYTSSSAGGGWLRPGWSGGLSGGYLLHIYYNQSR